MTPKQGAGRAAPGPASHRAALLLLPGLLAASLAAAEEPAAGTVLLSAQPIARDSSRFSHALDGRPIRSIDIRSHNVFDPLPEGPFRWVGGVANHAHLRTRTRVIREQLLLRPGDRWTAARASESVRLLRTLSFLAPLGIAALPAGDSVDVVVETRDVWSTQPEVNLEGGGGKVFGSLAFTENNLLGLGKSVSLAYREDPIGITRSAVYWDPGVLGSRVQLQVNGARGTSGASDGARIMLPFYATDARLSFGVSGLRTSGDARLFQNNAEVASLSQHIEETEVFVGRGVERNGDIARLTLSAGTLDRRLSATRIVSGVQPPASFVGPEERLRLHQVALELRLWRPRFIEFAGVDRPNRVEDFDLGPSVSLKLGAAPQAWGSSTSYGSFRAKLDGGISTPFGFGVVRTQVTGRWRRSPEEVLGTANGRWLWQSSPAHTFEAGVLGAAGTRPPRNYQLAVGGLNGLRAYPVHAVTGKRLLRWNVEDRHVLLRDVFQIATIGSAVFVDAARGWGSGAEGTAWFHDFGIGLRLAPPRAAIGPVIRADLAWPISPTRDGRREAVLSIGSSQAF